MNTTGEMLYEQQPLPFNTFSEKKAGNRNLHSKQTHVSYNPLPDNVDKVIAVFEGTLINDFEDELVPYNVA